MTDFAPSPLMGLSEVTLPANRRLIDVDEDNNSVDALVSIAASLRTINAALKHIADNTRPEEDEA